MISITTFDPVTLVLIAVLNPAVVITALWMGRNADQWQKVVVAGFAASLAGFALFWLGGQVGVFKVSALGGEAGLIAMQFLLGLIWAALGYLTRPNKDAR